MRLTVLSLAACLGFASAGVDELFAEFVSTFHKTYESQDERNFRKSVFEENLKDIGRFQRTEEGTATYSHLTPFADVAFDEFAKRHGFNPSLHDDTTDPVAPLESTELPDDFDWVAKGAVNPIKNQEQCGSCWSFATCANIEGAGFVTTGKLVSLSEQQLVDCDKVTGDQGCNGGLPSNAYKDMIQKDFGLETESEYPYTATDGSCKEAGTEEVAFITGWQKISQDEDQIAAALMKYGPLAIGINAGPMQMYHGGVAKPWSILCNPSKLDHGVAIVGFGVDSGTKYWKIRNSWGTSWGEEGYYRIIRGTGACGLNTMVTTATGVSLKHTDDTSLVV